MEPIARGRRIRHVAAWIFGLAVLLFGLVYVGISAFTADRLTQPTNRPLPIDPRRVSEDAREWSTRTNDGITLRGWYLPTEKKRHLLVLVHGMWSSWLEMAGLGRDLHDRGFDVLLFDLRGHGQSDPSRLYLGRRERADIRAVMSWALAAGFTNDRIGWLGYSMGGSTLLDGGRPQSPDPGGRDRQSLRRLPQAARYPAQPAQRTARLVQPGHPAGGPLDLRRADRRPGPDPVRPLVGRTAAPADSRRIRHDRARRPGAELARTLGSFLSDADVARRRARAGVPERPGGYVRDGRLVLRLPPQSVRPGNPSSRLADASLPLSRTSRRLEQRAQPGAKAGRRQTMRPAVGRSRAPVTRAEASAESLVGGCDQGPDAAVGAVGRQVRGLIEQPESLPIVARLAEVFRVDEQFLDSPGPVRRIVRQGDRAHPSKRARDATVIAKAATVSACRAPPVWQTPRVPPPRNPCPV